jgi:hypothetical protein
MITRQPSASQIAASRLPRRCIWGAIAGLALLGAACSWFAAPLIIGTPATPATAEAAAQGIALTVYNQGTALVRDRRPFNLQLGINELSFSDVASAIDPTSVLIKSIDRPSRLQVLEQNYEFDLVGAAALLGKYLGQKISVVSKDGTLYEGALLSSRDDIVMQDEGGRVRILKLNNIQEFSFPELPEGLITKPTLVWRVNADKAGPQDLELTYLTGGINWQADYVLLLAPDEHSLDLDGWVTLTNTSGASYREAQLKLIAGDLQRLAQAGLSARDLALEAAPQPTATSVEQRQFFEYHLYEIARPVTIKDNETKQVEFVSASGVEAGKFFVYDGLQCRSNPWYCQFSGYAQSDPSYGVASNPKVMVMVEFDSEDVDADLPAGRVRVYKQDTDGAALLVGEDSIDHTPKGEHVRLYVGDAFDIVGERLQTDFRRPSQNSLEEGFKITLRNHKDEAVEVRVVEHLSRWSEWKILRSSSGYTKLDSSTIEFRIQIPANGENQVSYEVRYVWP